MAYPDPLIIPPLSLPHQQTFVVLHGRGSSGDAFGPPLLDTLLSPKEPSLISSGRPVAMQSLATAFPHARFVFPSASRRRAALYKRMPTHQWFDYWNLEPPATEREELQNPGLRETTVYLHRLLRAEIELVPGGAKNVVVGGLSQGCAASLVALLLWEGEPLGAFVGMSGWLPYAYRMGDLVGMGTEGDGDDIFDPFQRNDPNEGETQDTASVPDRPIDEVTTWLREQIDLDRGDTVPRNNNATNMTPVFLGHGVLDDKVSVELGRMARDTLTKLGLHVTWKEYEGLGHWYSSDMLRDLTTHLFSPLRPEEVED
ncbi:alpha/beta-hydrolase [Apiospora kogelbergensis]|uniref:alpha/beta-hydrolase n=1 Tax=Apiospora kogelbergensis TaxID=1337665 RepID=UPI00312DAFC8